MESLCEETDWKLPWEGGCRCGKVRIRVTAPPLLASACHCTGCQKMSASAFSMSIAIPVAGFAVTGGDPVIGGLHAEAQHHFCGWCMSWMFTRIEGMDDFVNLRPTILDRHSWFIPFAEFWTSEKLPWVTTGAVHSFDGLPPLDEFPTLIEQYAARGVCRPG
ncbi:MAG: GFA family protein [Rhizorhabdus sp.]